MSYLPKSSSLPGSGPSQGGASIKAKLLKGEDGGLPLRFVSVKGRKDRHWFSCSGVRGFLSFERIDIGNGGASLARSTGRRVIQSGTCKTRAYSLTTFLEFYISLNFHVDRTDKHSVISGPEFAAE